MHREEILYGYHPVREALRRRPQEIAKIWIALRPGSSRRKEIESLSQRHRVEVEDISEQQLRERVGDRHHNGFGALLLSRGEDPAGGADPQLLVLLEDVQDPRNLGALLRVCEGAGVGKVMIRDRGTAPLSPTVVKTSAGAVQWLDIERITNPAREIRQLKKDGFWIYGADMAGVPAWEIDLTGPVVICVGGEAQGLRSNTRNHCDQLVSLPMRGHIQSLNVASASAALLYEALRQRLLEKGGAEGLQEEAKSG